jgi:glucoamylase
MPLVWAHSEYLKLAASRALGRPVDRPHAVWERYRGVRPLLRRVFWTEVAPVRHLPEGCALTIALRAPALVHWGLDGWRNVRDEDTLANSLGLHLLEIDTPRLIAGQSIDFTVRTAGGWLGQDFHITVIARSALTG